MSFVFGFVIAILIYSFVLTAVTVYKDSSNYYIVETIDIVFAGPIAWTLALVLFLLRPVYKLYKVSSQNKEKSYQRKDAAYIKRIVKKIVRNYLRKKEHNDYFNFNCMMGSEYGEYAGWYALFAKKPRYERLNQQFKKLMFHQKEETITELKKHFVKVTKEIMEKDNCAEWYISEYADKDLYTIQ